MSAKIDIMIIGAQKAGTTSLLRYMQQHPDIAGHSQKEMSYFHDLEYGHGYDKAFARYYKRRITKPSQKMLAKHATIYSSPEEMQRLKQHNPDCKLILLVRNPAERAFSSFLSEKYYGYEKKDTRFDLSVKDAIRLGEGFRFKIYIELGMYIKHITRLYPLFPKNNLKVVVSGHLADRPQRVLQEIFCFVGIDPAVTVDISKKHNVTRAIRSEFLRGRIRKLRENDNFIKKLAKKIVPESIVHKYGDLLLQLNKGAGTKELLDPATAAYLYDFYAPYNDQLAKEFGLDLSMWASK